MPRSYRVYVCDRICRFSCFPQAVVVSVKGLYVSVKGLYLSVKGLYVSVKGLYVSVKGLYAVLCRSTPFFLVADCSCSHKAVMSSKFLTAIDKCSNNTRSNRSSDFKIISISRGHDPNALQVRNFRFSP